MAAKIDKSKAAELLADDETFGTVAHIIAYSAFGNAIYEMDIQELFAELEDEFKVQLSQDVCQKLQAILLATTTDSFFEDKEGFRAIANTLIEGDPGFLTFDDLTVIEILWSSYEVSLNHPGREFDPAVDMLMNKELAEEGFDSEEEAEEEPYYDRAMTKLFNDFKGQIITLGLPTSSLKSPV